MSALNKSLTNLDWISTLNEESNGGGESVAKSQASTPDPANYASVVSTGTGYNHRDTEDFSESESPGPRRYGMAKPPHSYSVLIAAAIRSSEHNRMTLSEIYAWIMDRFQYYKTAGNSWKGMYWELKADPDDGKASNNQKSTKRKKSKSHEENDTTVALDPFSKPKRTKRQNHLDAKPRLNEAFRALADACSRNTGAQSPDVDVDQKIEVDQSKIDNQREDKRNQEVQNTPKEGSQVYPMTSVQYNHGLHQNLNPHSHQAPFIPHFKPDWAPTPANTPYPFDPSRNGYAPLADCAGNVFPHGVNGDFPQPRNEFQDYSVPNHGFPILGALSAHHASPCEPHSYAYPVSQIDTLPSGERTGPSRTDANLSTIPRPTARNGHGYDRCGYSQIPVPDNIHRERAVSCNHLAAGYAHASGHQYTSEPRPVDVHYNNSNNSHNTNENSQLQCRDNLTEYHAAAAASANKTKNNNDNDMNILNKNNVKDDANNNNSNNNNNNLFSRVHSPDFSDQDNSNCSIDVENSNSPLAPPSGANQGAISAEDHFSARSANNAKDSRILDVANRPHSPYQIWANNNHNNKQNVRTPEVSGASESISGCFPASPPPEDPTQGPKSSTERSRISSGGQSRFDPTPPAILDPSVARAMFRSNAEVSRKSTESSASDMSASFGNFQAKEQQKRGEYSFLNCTPNPLSVSFATASPGFIQNAYRYLIQKNLDLLKSGHLNSQFQSTIGANNGATNLNTSAGSATFLSNALSESLSRVDMSQLKQLLANNPMTASFSAGEVLQWFKSHVGSLNSSLNLRQNINAAGQNLRPAHNANNRTDPAGPTTGGPNDFGPRDIQRSYNPIYSQSLTEILKRVNPSNSMQHFNLPNQQANLSRSMLQNDFLQNQNLPKVPRTGLANAEANHLNKRGTQGSLCGSKAEFPPGMVPISKPAPIIPGMSPHHGPETPMRQLSGNCRTGGSIVCGNSGHRSQFHPDSSVSPPSLPSERSSRASFEVFGGGLTTSGRFDDLNTFDTFNLMDSRSNNGCGSKEQEATVIHLKGNGSWISDPALPVMPNTDSEMKQQKEYLRHPKSGTVSDDEEEFDTFPWDNIC